jgi:hypothetical protein
MSTESSKTYIFENVEVAPTGRIATRKIILSSKTHVESLIEIKPIDSTGPTWKKWVRQDDLYEVGFVD